MERPTKRKVVAGAIAGVVLAGAGGAIAATKLGSPGTSQAIIDDAAKRLNVQPSALSDALKQATLDQIDAAVKAGTLTQAQADKLKARVNAGDFPLFGLGGRGFAGPGFFGAGKMDVLSAAADYLHLTQQELMTQLRSGKTLAQIATAQGKTADGLVQAITDQITKDLDAAVTAGKLTADQEQKIEASLKQFVTAFVNGTGGKLGFGFGPHPFGGAPPSMPRPADGGWSGGGYRPI
jgi:hypothetical protein